MRNFLLILLFSMVTVPLFAQSQAMDIERIQALYIFNIYKHTKLPEKENHTIGLYGADQKLVNLLNGMFQGKQINGKDVSIFSISSLDTSADIVFVATKNSKQLVEYCKVNQPKFLLISQKSGLCEAGSMVNLLETNGKIQLEINEHNLHTAGYKISTELKSVAKGS